MRLRAPTSRPPQTESCAIDGEEVARVAYGLYEARERQDGHALEDWLKAEAIIRSRRRR